LYEYPFALVRRFFTGAKQPLANWSHHRVQEKSFRRNHKKYLVVVEEPDKMDIQWRREVDTE